MGDEVESYSGKNFKEMTDEEFGKLNSWERQRMLAGNHNAILKYHVPQAQPYLAKALEITPGSQLEDFVVVFIDKDDHLATPAMKANDLSIMVQRRAEFLPALRNFKTAEGALDAYYHDAIQQMEGDPGPNACWFVVFSKRAATVVAVGYTLPGDAPTDVPTDAPAG